MSGTSQGIIKITIARDAYGVCRTAGSDRWKNDMLANAVCRSTGFRFGYSYTVFDATQISRIWGNKKLSDIWKKSSNYLYAFDFSCSVIAGQKDREFSDSHLGQCQFPKSKDRNNKYCGTLENAHALAAKCSHCPPGQYNPYPHIDGCEPCWVDSYPVTDPTNGKTVCTRCPNGYSTLGQDGQDVCLKLSTDESAFDKVLKTIADQSKNVVKTIQVCAFGGVADVAKGLADQILKEWQNLNDIAVNKKQKTLKTVMTNLIEAAKKVAKTAKLNPKVIFTKLGGSTLLGTTVCVLTNKDSPFKIKAIEGINVEIIDIFKIP